MRNGKNKQITMKYAGTVERHNYSIKKLDIFSIALPGKRHFINSFDISGVKGLTVDLP